MIDGGTLVAEGDRACQWLGAQPWALWHNAKPYRIPVLEQRYSAELQSQPLSWGDAA